MSQKMTGEIRKFVLYKERRRLVAAVLTNGAPPTIWHIKPMNAKENLRWNYRREFLLAQAFEKTIEEKAMIAVANDTDCLANAVTAIENFRDEKGEIIPETITDPVTIRMILDEIQRDERQELSVVIADEGELALGEPSRYSSLRMSSSGGPQIPNESATSIAGSVPAAAPSASGDV